ncbi:MAG: vanadium-dependent haloperoxidase [Thermoanaerobaculia bacterium]|nr:vanadium-dependent haloperoxidase [Thermoanaerobaculia bacterium]
MSHLKDDPEVSTEPTSTEVSRRGFLKGVGSTGAVAAATSLGLGSLAAPEAALAEEIGPQGQIARRLAAYTVRNKAALYYLTAPLSLQPSNTDEQLYADKRASYSKGLDSNELGEPTASAYQSLRDALSSGDPADFEAIELYSPNPFQFQTCPQGSLAFEMFGIDSHAGRIEPFPAFVSNHNAALMGEVYWQCISRDVPFNHYDTDTLIGAAVDDLDTSFSFKIGPTTGGHITPGTIFRGPWSGCLAGPHVSQFLWLPIPYGQQLIHQQFPVPVEGADYGTTYADWLSIQRDEAPDSSLAFQGDRYIYSMRAGGEWVHRDFAFQGPLNAALILFLRYGTAALADSNPYKTSLSQNGFVTFSLPGISHLVAMAGDAALKAAWFQKWLVHRRLRPEALAGRVENQTNGSKNYGLHPDLVDSDAVSYLLSTNGTALLPLAFPEGSPTHPAYPAGHATFSAAGATICKAFYKEDFVIPDPVVSNDDGTALDDWTGEDLTVLGELNKLVANISLFRDGAGVHYRADGEQGNLLGEQVAIGILRDYSRSYNESFTGFTLTKFNGQKILIKNGNVSNV